MKIHRNLPVLLFGMLLLLCSLAFLKPKPIKKMSHPTIIYSKGDPYKKPWAKIDSLEEQGLTRSALDAVNTLYTRAKKANNHPQVAKTLIYRIKYNEILEEGAFTSSIRELEKEAETAAFPLKPVLHSLLGNLYWEYYQNNRWAINERSETVNFDNDDIATWDLKKLATETLNHYQASLQNIDSLTRTPVNTFEAIIQKGGGDREKYRPWLSDFLAHRALDFFTNGELAITRPAEIFTLDDEKYFLPYQDFKDLNINHPDRLSFSYQALRIFQQLLAAHVENSSPEALVDVELKRLDFVFQHSTLSNKVEKYYQALERLHRQYSTLSVSAEVAYKMALQLQIKGNSYHPFQNKKTQWELKKAIALCNSAIAVFPKSYGADQCRSLESRIFEKSIKLTTEKVNVPNLPFRALVSYKNINKIYLKAVKVDWDDYQKTIRHDRRDYFLQLNKRQSLKEWTVGWEDNSDYQPHSLEIKIDGMPKGFYILVAATSPDFNIDHEAATYTPFWVSNLSYLTRSDNAMNTDIFVFDRKTGEPIAGAKAELFYDKYSSITRNYTPKKINEYLTDKDGHIRVFSAALNDVNNYYINLSTSDDRLNTRDFQYHYSFYREEHKEIRTLFFTDRAIYRPGQSVFFKGLVFETDGKNNLIKTGHTSTVALYDVNNQKVSELIQITNEWGTFSGSFTVPNTGLTGQMYISDGQNRKYIAVEEYKRPKFEVVFNPVEGNFKVNEQIKVSGMATTYSGVALDEAEVSYRVVRNTHVPYSFYHWESHWPETPLVEITNGAIKTNDEGGFDITFPALPDAAISRDMQPTFQYTVYADVTDINGETHSSTTLVQVGYHALNLSVDVPETVNKSGKDRFALNTTNLNGQFVPASGNIKIWSLEEPKRYFRSRLWSQPDQHIIRETEYIKDFPHDVYKDEDDYRQWSKKIKVYDHDFNTKNSQEITLYKLPEWRAGRYILEATAMDAYGQEVKALNYITVFGENEKDCPVNEMGWFTPLKTAGEPGEIAEFLIGSVARNVKVLYEIEHDGTITHREWFTLHSGQKKVSLPIEEKHRGNFAVHFTFVKHGRNFRYGELIRVPYTNKQLDLTFETFRNKLLPGQKEEWRVKIKNKNGEKAAAEMLATMYDASLDAFAENDWPLNILKYHYGSYTWDDNSSFSVVNSTLFQQDWNLFKRFETRLYDKLDWFGYSFGHRYRYLQKVSSRFMEVTTEEPEEEIDFEFAANVEKDEDADELLDLDLKVNQSKPTLQKPTPLDNIQARTNFNETAFFYPHLTTNEAGEILISFTMPEALTRWKFMGLAHSKDLKTGQLTAETITQKDLMVYPNAPRFFREGDRMTFSSKITNLADKDLKGTAKIFFFNALNMQPIGAEILRSNDTNPFTLPHGKSTSVSWDIHIPEGYQAITYRVVAQAGHFSDGEEMAIPVLTNRMLVTEALPLPIRGGQSKTFVLDKLANNQSTTLTHHKLTLEFTSNPAWYAVQALPYLMEYPYECSEQVFSRFYANALASHIVNSSPRIKAVFEAWKGSPEAFLSNLEKNQELKALMLEETPWVLQATDEQERKKRVALLFDVNRMQDELGRAMTKLQQAQLNNGGWPWFKGMREDRYITQHIVTGLGHLDHLGVGIIQDNEKVMHMMQQAVSYLDGEIHDDYQSLKKRTDDLKKEHITRSQIHYLYARSFFLKEVSLDAKNKEAYTYYLEQAASYWNKKDRYTQGMIALALLRNNADGHKKTTDMIMASLRENAIQHEELGMYWKENTGGYYWYQAPIETQSLLIEAFDEVANDRESVEAMKLWLLKQKQTQDWKTTKATAAACYALLLSGTDWLVSDTPVELWIGREKIDPFTTNGSKPDAGTGYFKTSWNGGEISPEMATAKVTKKDDGVAWGALYWQYFEQLDKITPHKTPLQLDKKLFLRKNTPSGPVITPVEEDTALKPGDKIRVRIELRSDRDMEYVHMKDMRAAGLEPVNVFSGYRWQDNLGYYESTKDASTNFFFDYLPKGTYVFEYDLTVNIAGNFSNGVTSIQCMYAPEFGAHSEGGRIVISSK